MLALLCCRAEEKTGEKKVGLYAGTENPGVEPHF
jgi:hypothetical protein